MRVHIRHAAVIFLLIIFTITLISGFASTLFISPTIQLVNIGASRITHISLGSFIEVDTDTLVPGANATLTLRIDFFHVDLNIKIDLPYGFTSQNIFTRYNLNDIPCKAYGANFKLGQVFSILAIFSAVFTIIFAISVIFTRILLPLVWGFVWWTIICIGIVNATLFKALCDGFCQENNNNNNINNNNLQIPEFASLAMPGGGFALYVMSMCAFLFIAILTVFL